MKSAYLKKDNSFSPFSVPIRNKKNKFFSIYPHFNHQSFQDLEPGTYGLHAWVRVDSETEAEHVVHVGMKSPTQQLNQSKIVATGVAKSNCWTKIEGGFNVGKNQGEFLLHFGGVPGDRRLLLTSFGVAKIIDAKWKANQNKLINRVSPFPPFIPFFPFRSPAFSYFLADAHPSFLSLTSSLLQISSHFTPSFLPFPITFSSFFSKNKGFWGKIQPFFESE